MQVECKISANRFIFNLTHISQSAVWSVVFPFLVVTTGSDLDVVLHGLTHQKTLAE
jgi:hypothetical protein